MSAKLAVESSAIIDRSVDEVWTFVSDPRNEPRWHTDILEVRSASDPESGPGATWVLGATYLVTVQFMGRNEYGVEVTALDAKDRLQFTTRTGPLRPVSTYVFAAVDGATRFTRQVELPLRGPMRIMGLLLRPSLDRRNASFVQNLKRILEQ